MKNKTELHVHNDLDLLKTVKDKLGNKSFSGRWIECYIMQENKIVFVGTQKRAKEFIILNEGKVLNAL